MKFISWASLNSLFLFTTATFSFLSSNATPLDSLGLVKKEGKSFIKHKIDKGNTLYSLSKRYGATVSSISDANPDIPVLKPGLVLLVPTLSKFHTVVKGETLYSIARNYNVSVSQIKKDNSLVADDLELGKNLIINSPEQIITERKSAPSSTLTQHSKKLTDNHIVSSGETLFSIAQKHGTSVTKLKDINNLTSNSLILGQTLQLPQKALKTITRQYNMMKSNSEELDNNFCEIISPEGKINEIALITSPSGQAVYARIVKNSYDGKVYASHRVYKLLDTKSFSSKITLNYTE